ncbi:mitochondrial fission ELM1 family protein [bacterium]|nr:mitochondrial fission ELM1 family protein [bacterium]
MTDTLSSKVNAAAPPGNAIGVAPSSTKLFETGHDTARTFVLSTAKNGHVTQCIAVADLIGKDIEDVLQIPGLNKALPNWLMEVDKIRWFLPALRMAWKFRKGKFLILASGRSALVACRFIKVLRGNNVLILFIGSPKNWTAKCADIMLRPEHEREDDSVEDNRYPWNPKQVWVNSPICRPLPVSGKDRNEVAVLLGGLNITYGDEIDDYSAFLEQLEPLIEAHPVSIVFSRRTKAEVIEAVEQRFGHTNAKMVDAADRQGFLDACEGASAFVVTPDSITMVAEACATGKPVYTAKLPLKRSDTRNHRFIETSLKNGYAQEFEGDISFERCSVSRDDVDIARRDISTYVEAWLRDPSTLTS